MGACNLSANILNTGIRIKEELKNCNHHSAWKAVDQFLCQYDYRNIYDKEELICSMLSVCHVRGYGDLYISGMEYYDWINLVVYFSELLKEHQRKLNDEISKINFEKIIFEEKEFEIKRDVFNWIIKKDAIVFLLKENNDFFNDNLVAIRKNGSILWSSKDIIDTPNRMGACFVGLRENEDCSINAHAYVGINYLIEVHTGKVISKIFTK